MTAATVPAFSYASNGLNASVTNTAPTGVVAGDLLVAFVICSLARAYSATGWTASNSGNATMLYKIATGSDSYVFSQGTAAANRSLVLRISGQNAATPIEGVVGVVSTASANPASTPLTASKTDTLHIIGLMPATTAPVVGMPSGFTTIVNTNSSPVQTRAAGYQVVNAGLSTPPAWTASAATQGVFSLLVNPAQTDYVADQSDSITITDAPSKSPGKRPADTVTPSDSLTRKAVVKSPADTVTPTDMPVKAVTKSPADTATVADAPSKGVSKTPSDSVSATDAPSVTPGKGFSDSATITDAATKAVGKFLAETVTVTDGTVKGVSKSPVDQVALTDAIVKAVVKTLTDTVTATDAATVSLGVTRTFEDTVALTDLVVKAVVKALADAVTPSDAIAKEVWKGFADTATLSDSIAMSVGKFIDQSDFVFITDSILLALGFEIPLSDSITPTDGISQKVVGKGAGDTVTPTDGITGKGVGHGLADSVAPTDARAKGVVKLRSDIVTPTDSALVRRGIGLGLADTITPTDAPSKVIGKRIGDTITPADETSLTTGTSRAPIDSINVTDSILISQGHNLFLEDSLCVQSDFPITTPTKQICGYVYDHESLEPGAVIENATVRLFRAMDDLMVQITTTDALGYYEFLRDAADPYTYYVTAEYTAGPQQIHGISDRGLVPEPV